MSPDRREFISIAAKGMSTAMLAALPLRGTDTVENIKAIAFDAFPIFSPLPVFELAEQIFPGHGVDLSNIWRTRQFEYQWLRALSDRYADFWQTTEDALLFSANSLKLDLTPAKRTRLMNAYLALRTWPDVQPALKSLSSMGMRMAFLSNATSKILEAGIVNSSLENIFEHVLSTDKQRTYKPHPRAYQMAIDAFGLRKEEVLFVAFAGWDAAGAKSFGYQTFWVNRFNSPAERLGFSPDALGTNLNDLVTFVRVMR